MKKILVYGLVLALFLVAYQCSDILAQSSEENLPSAPGVDTSSMQREVYGIVGNVEYTEYKPRGESKIFIKDKKGEQIDVSLQQIEPGATVLATYRKVKDKKGNEKNVLVSLSVVKNAQATRSRKKK